MGIGVFTSSGGNLPHSYPPSHSYSHVAMYEETVAAKVVPQRR